MNASFIESWLDFREIFLAEIGTWPGIRGQVLVRIKPEIEFTEFSFYNFDGENRDSARLRTAVLGLKARSQAANSRMGLLTT